MSQHTPGPWRWLSDDVLVGDHAGRPVVITSCLADGVDDDAGNTCLAQPSKHKGVLETFDSKSANARLIAAAPEMYEVLLEMVRGDEFYDGEFEERARAALKKAGWSP